MKFKGMLDLNKIKIPWFSNDSETSRTTTETTLETESRPSAEEWISNWKDSQSIEEERPSAKEWIENWRNNQ